jgi:hypothetical protein
VAWACTAGTEQVGEAREKQRNARTSACSRCRLVALLLQASARRRLLHLLSSAQLWWSCGSAARLLWRLAWSAQPGAGSAGAAAGTAGAGRGSRLRVRS